MSETVNDIRGKGLEYEERTQRTIITEKQSGTVAAFIGGANYGPVGVPTRVLKDFKKYFGSEVNRDVECKDFSAFAAKNYLNASPNIWFTRITDGTDQKAKKIINRISKAATIVGEKIIKGTKIVVNTGENTLRIVTNTGNLDFTFTESSSVSNQLSNVITDGDIRHNSFTQFKVGDYIEIELDGKSYSYIVSENDMFMKLTDILDNQFATYKNGVLTPSYGFAKLTFASNSYNEEDADLSVSINGGPNLTIDGNTTVGKTVSALATQLQTLVGSNAKVISDETSITIYSLIPGETSSVEITGLDSFITTNTPTLTFEDGVNNVIAPQRYSDRLAIAINKLLFGSNANYATSEYFEIIRTSYTFQVSLKSSEVGASSSIKIFSFANVFNATHENPIVITGSNFSIESVVSEISNNGIEAFINSSGYFELRTAGKSADSTLLIDSANSSDEILAMLGIKDEGYSVADVIYTGSDANPNICTFTSKYSGVDGNNIKLIKTTNDGFKSIAIYFFTDLIGTIFNYSNKVSDSLFIGNLINNDTNINQKVVFSYPDGLTEIEDFEDGIYTLSGGTSGLADINDMQYVAAIDPYYNEDLYYIDLIAVPGNSNVSIIEKLQDICKTRKDCFTIVDAPETVAGCPGGVKTGGDSMMLYWHNGLLENSIKLDNKYLTTYFPWVLIGTESNKISKQWFAPSVTICRMIAEADKKLSGMITGAPAGATFGKLPEVEDLAYYIREKDRRKLYDDQYGNNVNPIVYNVNKGFFCDGEKTTLRDLGDYSRIHTMRTSLFIKRKIFEIAPDFFWLEIDKTTMDNLIERYKKDICKPLEAIKAIKPNWEIICSVVNNPETVSKSRGMVVEIRWESVDRLEKLKAISTLIDDIVTVEL